MQNTSKMQSACLDENRLANLGESLEASELDEMREHAESCSPCRVLLETFAKSPALAPARSEARHSEIVPRSVQGTVAIWHQVIGEAGFDATLLPEGTLPMAPRTQSDALPPSGTDHTILLTDQLVVADAVVALAADVPAQSLAVNEAAAVAGNDAQNATSGMSRVGAVLRDKWKLDAILGVGGMGKVYAATHRNGRRFAIKVMREELACEPDLVARFVQEGYVANQIAHTAAVSVVDDDKTDDGVPFLVMDLLEGENMRQRLQRGGPVELPQALHWIDEVLDVLAVAHALGVVHRDIKPDNLFIASDGTVRVLDFGLARVRDGISLAKRTKSGIPIGTIGFMPPEQALGQVEKMAASSDVWALGATLFTMLSGRKVHEASSHVDGIFLAMTEPVRMLRERLPHVPQAIVQVLERALAFSQEMRFVDARELRQALRAARASAGLSREQGHSPASSPLRLLQPQLASQGIALGRVTPVLQRGNHGTLMLRPSPARADSPELRPNGEGSSGKLTRKPTFFEVFAPGREAKASLPAQGQNVKPSSALAPHYVLRVPTAVLWAGSGFLLCLVLVALIWIAFGR
jgi:serine/threonine protein kinase